MKSGVLSSCLAIVATCVAAGSALAGNADPMVIPGVGPEGAVVHQPAQHHGHYRQQGDQRQRYYAGPPATHFRPGAKGPGGNYGGGFIELLMTGGTRSAPPRAVLYNQPPVEVIQPAYAPVRQAVPTVHVREPRQGAVYAALPPADPVMRRPIDPQFMKQDVAYAGKHAPGTIVVDTPNRFLYLVTAPGRATRYGIGVGRPGFEWAGVKSVTRKAEWPDWRPPPEMLKRRPDLPTYMAGGPDNPLGARALYLGSSLYRIHGTNEPHTIGQNVSSGCIRMMNDDVIDLYSRVRVGAKVVVM